MAEVFDALGERDNAAHLRDKAKSLKEKFEAAFWSDEINFYALALDKNKKPVLSVASNPGHLLWSGIVSPAHAQAVAQRLMQSDMWSGWGIRTLSAKHHAYNPHSYHLGSVWPHDNGIIALGFKRYGLVNEAAAVARDISRAASYFVSHRIPELYAGNQRQIDNFPVQYMGANVPQAWAAGSIFHLLQAITGIQADAPSNMLYVDPQLPKWLPDLSLYGLTIGDAMLDLHFTRQGDQTIWDAQLKKGNLQIVQKAWEPWQI
jgi:glycogen debranching enzyme